MQLNVLAVMRDEGLKYFHSSGLTKYLNLDVRLTKVIGY